MTIRLREATEEFKRNNELRNELSIAASLGIHPNRWNQIKNGNIIPNRKEIKAISKLLNEDSLSLFGDIICKKRGIK